MHHSKPSESLVLLLPRPSWRGNGKRSISWNLSKGSTKNHCSWEETMGYIIQTRFVASPGTLLNVKEGLITKYTKSIKINKAYMRKTRTYLHFTSQQCNSKGKPENLSYWDMPFASCLCVCPSKVERNYTTWLTMELYISFFPFHLSEPVDSQR